MKGIVTYEGEQEVEVGDRTFTVSFTATAECQFQRGRFSGPPEDCYPDEGECNITEIKIDLITNEEGDDVNSSEIIAACRAGLNDEAIADACWEEFTDSRHD